MFSDIPQPVLVLDDNIDWNHGITITGDIDRELSYDVINLEIYTGFNKEQMIIGESPYTYVLLVRNKSKIRIEVYDTKFKINDLNPLYKFNIYSPEQKIWIGDDELGLEETFLDFDSKDLLVEVYSDSTNILSYHSEATIYKILIYSKNFRY